MPGPVTHSALDLRRGLAWATVVLCAVGNLGGGWHGSKCTADRSDTRRAGPPRKGSRARGWRPSSILAALFIAASVTLMSGVGAAASPHDGPSTGVSPQGWAPTVGDGGVIKLLKSGLTLSVLTDHTRFVSGSAHSRSYTISVSVTVPISLALAHIETYPLSQWGNPAQFPGGVDALPPFSYWSWSIFRGPVNDTSNWTAYQSLGLLLRTIPWVGASFTVSGSVFPRFAIHVGALTPTGYVAPAVGYVATDVLGPSSNIASDADFLRFAQSVHPGLIRFGVTTIGLGTKWNNATALPQFHWQSFDQIVNFSKALPSQVLMSLPAGTWGDGNALPTGMPLNTSYLVNFYGASGYFPALKAYAAYIGTIVQHVLLTGANITYWSVGNEVPRYSPAEVNEYIQVFNTAAATIHKTFPSALVGSDVMMDPNYIRQFATHAHGVGFLSFHYYAATGICLHGTVYCPPTGGAAGTTDPTIVGGPNYIGHLGLWDAPALAQMLWRNITGQTLPVVDSESNLNHMGGQYTTIGGTDPRIPTLFGASWLATTLIQSVWQNLSAFLYFGFSGPAVQSPTNTSQYGGWGFQLTSEGTHDNDTKYAPYWALKLWGSAIQPGASALSTTGSDPLVVEAQAFRRGTSGLSILVVNRVNATVHVTLNVSGANEVPTSLRILGPGSYVQAFNPATQTESLLRSTLYNAPTPPANPVHLTLRGYSVAMLEERFVPGPTPAGSTNSTIGVVASLTPEPEVGDASSSPVGAYQAMTQGSGATSTSSVATHAVWPMPGTASPLLTLASPYPALVTAAAVPIRRIGNGR
ncbi:MAG: hypothetical protein L3K19_03515 [Thermoplasmata archaeon]|nr:hypothetical protein [Thermoplasmata archaeon]